VHAASIIRAIIALMMEQQAHYAIDQGFPTGVSQHPGVSRGTTRCVAKLKKIFKLRLMMIMNN
jgi:hypothetical protein